MIGIDLTEAPVKIANRTRKRRALNNVHFVVADAEQLPCIDGELDIAVRRFAFHHFAQRARVLAQMSQVCRPGGTIAAEDLYSSGVPARAFYYNHLERLRDHSYTRALAPTELQRMFSDELIVELESWLDVAKTDDRDAAEVRRLLEEDWTNDLSGAQPFRRDGTIRFQQRTLALTGRKNR